MDGPFARGWRTAVCVASGPSLDHEQADAIAIAQRAGICHTITANNSWLLLPSTDVLYACDEAWWHMYIADVRAANPPGELWTQDKVAADQYGLHHVPSTKSTKGPDEQPGLTTDPTCIHSGGNSGYQMINLVYLFGARRIILVGFDMQSTHGRSRWHGDHQKPLRSAQPFDSWIPRFSALAWDLHVAGVKVINATRETALKCFQRADLASALEAST